MKFFAWIRHWFGTAAAASSRKDFYRRLDDRKIGEALAHLALLAVFLWVAPFLIAFFVEMRGATEGLMEGLRTRVPAGTVFEMKQGTLSSNLQEPLVFSEGSALFVIDTATATSALPPYEGGAGSTIVVGHDGIMQRTSDHDARFTSFKKAPDFSISRESALIHIQRWTPLALFLLAIVGTLAVFGVTWVGFLATVALHGAVLWLALKLAKRAWSWKRAFIASAFAATLPIALNAVFSAAGLALGALPNILYWLILIWIAYDVITRSRPASEKGESDERQKDAAVDRPHEDRRHAE